MMLIQKLAVARAGLCLVIGGFAVRAGFVLSKCVRDRLVAA
jgi:hypothetical protein